MPSTRRNVLLVLLGLAVGLLLSSLLGGTGVLAQSYYGSYAGRPGPVPLQGQGRFQVSSWGNGRGGYGCYIIDTATGETWKIESSEKPAKIGDKLTP